MKKILLTGGGTVGHVTLNLLLIPKLLEDGFEVHYIGDQSGIEYQQILQTGLPVTFHGIKTGKLRRYFSWENLKDVFKVAWGIVQSLVIVLKLRPQALFSKGGFVSVPPVIAARLAGVPVFIHESDLSMGLANKIASRFATKVYTTFEKTAVSPNMSHVGAITKVSRDEVLLPEAILDVKAHFDPTLPTVLFVGGSGGAKVFNEFVSQNQDRLTSCYNVINLTGDSQLNTLSKNLYRLDYATATYLPLLQLADLVVTRGGANTLFELLALRKLHIIVPLGKKASRGDQLENAAYFADKGYALTLPEEDLRFEALSEMITQVLEQAPHYYANMEHSQDLQTLERFYDRLMADMNQSN